MAKSRVREYSFDVVKFLAIAVIVLHHYQQDVGVLFVSGPNWYNGEFYWGYLVELFFIISGYFTLGSIKRVQDGESFGAFYLKKYLRFLPMLVICGFVCLATKYVCLTYVQQQADVSFTLWNVAASLTGVARWLDTSLMVNNPMWYISVLLLCLIVFYFVTARCSRAENLMLVYGIVIAAGLVMRSLCADGLRFPFFNGDIARGLICFFIGLELAILLRRHPNAVNRLTVPLSLIVIAMFVLFYAMAREAFVGEGSLLYYTLVFMVYPSVIILCKSSVAQRLFSTDRLSFLGGTAYNMYVWHLPLLFLWRIILYSAGLNAGRQLSMYLFLASCFVVGYLSSRFIDDPLSARVMACLSRKRQASS